MAQAVSAERSTQLDEVMHAPVLAIPPDMRVMDALQFADRHSIHHLPIRVDGALVGLVCTCDLLECDPRAPVSSAMHPPVTIERSASCRQAAEVAAQDGVGSLLVTDDSGVVGIVTRGDLMRSGVEPPAGENWCCAFCGSTSHLRADRRGRPICMDCADRAVPSYPGDEVGGGAGGD